MAPSANKSPVPKPSGRPTNTRPAVVPVIPLPFVQKQQQQRLQKQQELQQKQQQEKEEQARREKEAAADTPTSDTKPDGHDGHAKTQQTSTPFESNGKKAAAAPVVDTADNAAPPSPPPSTAPQAADDVLPAPPSPASTTQQAPSAPIAPGASRENPADAAAKPATGDVSATTAPSTIPSDPLPAIPSQDARNAPDMAFATHLRIGSGARHFDPPRHGPDGRHPLFHQSHHSNNSITFGTLRDSNNVSPAASGHGPGPLSPPPGLLGPMQPMPYGGPNMGPGEWQGPPGMPAVGDMNGHTPTSAGFNHSAPGSFYSSHSPDHVMNRGSPFGHQGGPFPVPGPNGHGHIASPTNEMIPAMMPGPLFPPLGFPSPQHHERHAGRDLLSNMPMDVQFVHHLEQHLQHSLDDPHSSDCHLFLHFPKQPVPPPTSAAADLGVLQQLPQSTTFAGHRSILSQSYSVSRFLHGDSGTILSGPFNRPVLVLHLTIADPYMTADAAVKALRSLYGLVMEGAAGSANGSKSQAMDRALADLTAGFIFMLGHVEAMAVDQAARLLDWETVEAVLAYCLNGASFPNVEYNHADVYGLPYPRAAFRYGRGAGLPIRRLLRSAVDFVLQNIPSGFVFNPASTSTAGPLSTLSRLPVDVDVALGETSAAGHSLAENSRRAAAGGPNSHGRGVNGTHLRSSGSVSLPVRAAANGAANAKQGSALSAPIVFGDFAPRHEPADADSSNATGTDAASPADSLSRILTNLPFGYAKYILEHPALGVAVPGAASVVGTVERQTLARAVVAERERCRQLALDSVSSGRLFGGAGEQRAAVLGRVRSPVPPMQRSHSAAVDGWDVLGWKELYHGDTGEVARIWAQAEGRR